MSKSARFSFIMGGVGILILLLVGSVVGISLLRTSQDVRNQASVKSGVVRMSVLTPPADQIQVNQPLNLDLRINTSGAAVDAVQIKADITGVPVRDVTFTPASTLNELRPFSTKVNNSQIELVFILNNSEQPLVASSDVTLGRLTVTPSQAGNLRLNWDNVFSKATLYKRGVDSLSAITPLSVVVVAPGAVQPTITPSSSPSNVQLACEASGGVWRQFPDSCGDSCGVTAEVMCARIPTYGCDCGGNACWNGQTCAAETPERPTPRPTASPDPFECVPRPTCLDNPLPCRIAEPQAGWCPRPSGVPSPTPPPTSRPTPSPTTHPECVRAGCSGQLCVSVLSREIVTTCEFRAEYACYQAADCTVQADGTCGFTPTDALRQCLASAGSSPLPSITPTPSPSIQPVLIYDLNDDGRVNLADLTLFIQYLQASDPRIDFNQDGRVNILDYSLFIQQLGSRVTRQ